MKDKASFIVSIPENECLSLNNEIGRELFEVFGNNYELLLERLEIKDNELIITYPN